VWARIGTHSNYRTEHQALDALQPALAAAGPAASAPAP